MAICLEGRRNWSIEMGIIYDADRTHIWTVPSGHPVCILCQLSLSPLFLPLPRSISASCKICIPKFDRSFSFMAQSIHNTSLNLFTKLRGGLGGGERDGGRGGMCCQHHITQSHDSHRTGFLWHCAIWRNVAGQALCVFFGTSGERERWSRQRQSGRPNELFLGFKWQG